MTTASDLAKGDRRAVQLRESRNRSVPAVLRAETAGPRILTTPPVSMDFRVGSGRSSQQDLAVEPPKKPLEHQPTRPQGPPRLGHGEHPERSRPKPGEEPPRVSTDPGPSPTPGRG